jgi:predicted Rossmann-fold nucleotide-binding protein
LLNVASYYDPLHAFLDRTVAEGFVQPVVRDMLMVEDDPERMLDRFATYHSPRLKKWVEEDET